MKKNILLAVLLTALFLAPFSAARGETEPAFTVDETAALQGMDRSYIQGYTPGVNGNRWTMILPVRSELAAGNITAELVTSETCNTFFRTRQITCQAWEEENDVWGVRFNVPVFADVRNADYDCVIRVTGQDAQGNALNAEFPYTINSFFFHSINKNLMSFIYRIFIFLIINRIKIFIHVISFNLFDLILI